MSNKPIKKTTTSSVWGGRFTNGSSEIMTRINASIDFDKNMYSQDIDASKAHAKMLVQQKIISKEDGKHIIDGLEQIANEIESGLFEFKAELEDIHMNIESRLIEIIGDPGRRLHTARSRNDQVATDFKLWVRDELDNLDLELKALQRVLLERGEEHWATICPGFTHLQNAQPVTIGHHLLAYVEMIGRDRGRIIDCRKRLNENPLGSGALAGTSFPIDRHMTSKALGFDRPTSNSLDSVSDRDFAMEYLSLASILSVHLSRLADEIVIWASPSFGLVNLSDAYSTGSSMLPHKKNPDAAELVRAKSGRIIGNLTSLLIVMKGLPLAYSKDLQEDKEPVFETANTLALSLAAISGMMNEIEFDKDKLLAAAKLENPNSIELADWLVNNLDKPFREAHLITGKIVKLAENKECALEKLSISDMQRIEPEITRDVYRVLDIQESIKTKMSFGGPAPKIVKEALAKARLKYLD